MNYLFFLGRTVELCFAELEVVLERHGHVSGISRGSGNIAYVTEINIDVSSMISVLGGTKKIAVSLSKHDISSIEDAILVCVEDLAQNSHGTKVEFGVSVIGSSEEIDAEKVIKKKLKELGVKARFIRGGEDGLNAAQIKHNKALDYHIIQEQEKYIVAKTLVVQDVDDWSKRDYEKPYRDAKRGMLPPKLARMIVNLSIGNALPEKSIVLDPFCGSGTVLMEALMLGASSVGSDIAQEAVHGAGKNLFWLKEQWHVKQEYSLSVQDAVHISKQTIGRSVTSVATEPFLGKQNPSIDAAKNILKGLEKMYLGFLKNLTLILEPGSNVVMIFPQLTFGKSVKNMHSLIDRLESLGYTREKGPYLYTRPHTIVQREIYLLRKS